MKGNLKSSIKKWGLIQLICLWVMPLSIVAQVEKDPIDMQMDAAMEENGSTAGMVEAITTAQEKWEAKLNSKYKSLKQKMPPDEFAALQQAQRAWIAYRDKQIESYAITYGKMDGTMWIPIHASAVMQLTKQRAQELENILGLLDERSE
jgi:uncharacterized protein YecT (DUF1311 family)